MAKAKTKTQSSMVPKRIAGIKVPKNVRSTGDKIIEALHHPLIADFAAAALIAAANALRENEDVRKTVRKAKDKVDAGAVTLGSVAATKGKGKKKKK